MKIKALGLALLFLLSGCVMGNNSSSNLINDDKIIIESNQYDKKYIELNKDNLMSLISNEISFLLFIYSSSCISCDEFSPIINRYVAERHATIYGIDVDKESTDLVNGIVSFKYTPTIMLYSKGNVYKRFDEDNNKLLFSGYNSFINEIDKYVQISKYRAIRDESELDKLILEEKNFYIYYSLFTCADCHYFRKYFFDSYTESQEKIVYTFDMALYFKSSKEAYNAFTKKYELSLEGNSILGYKGGVVPTIHAYQDSKVSAARVIYNDVFETTYDEYGEVTSLKVISSYYDDNPFINRVFEKNEIESARDIYHKKTLDYFANKAKEII